GNASSNLQGHAVSLLGYNDDPATRDLLLSLLARANYYLFETVLESARRLWGRDSLEPDYAAVQNTQIDEYVLDDLFRRLQEHADARRLLEILRKLNRDAAERVKSILMSRQPLPVAEAEIVVAGPDAIAAGVAAHLLGRAAAATSGKAVAAALLRWWNEWDAKRRDET